MVVRAPLHPRLGRAVALAVALPLIALGAHRVAWSRGPAPPRATVRDAAGTVPRPHAAILRVRLHDPGLDLAHFLDADRPGGFDVVVARVRPDAIGVTGDVAAWRTLVVDMDPLEAEALAYRLRQLPPIADAWVDGGRPRTRG